MTKIFVYGSLTLGLACLALGWATAGYYPVSAAALALIPLSLYMVRRKKRFFTGLVLTLTVIGAAAGLWVGVELSFALMAVVIVLAAWDLDNFSRRLVFASVEDDPQQIERRHLMQLNLILLAGVGAAFLAQLIRLKSGFELALILAILAFYGVGALLNGMRSEEE